MLFGRKECLNTLRLVHHELAVSHSHRATPSPSPQPSGVEGVDLCASVEAADHQCWLVVVSNIVIFCVFYVDYSNMYNLSINELYILRGNLYIFPHNRIVCVRMVILFYPATRARVHFMKCDHSVLLPPASGAGRPGGLGVLNSSVPLESLGPVQLPLVIFTFEVKILRKLTSFGNKCKLTPSFEVLLRAFSIYQRK